MIVTEAANTASPSTKATIGQTTARIESTVEVTASTAAKTGLATPPVATVEVKRALVVTNCVEVATPPPAITASVQRQNGSTSGSTEPMAKVPATVAAGTAMESRALSTQGMKYPAISAAVA